MFRFLIFSIFTAVVVADVHVTGNPYTYNEQCPIAFKKDPSGSLGKKNSDVSSTSFLIDLTPTNVLLSPKLPVQTDTIRGVTSAKLQHAIGHFRAPVYTFSQSSRLVENPFSFDLLLLREISSPLVVSIPVGPVGEDMENAGLLENAGLDSWFPGYYWEVLLVYDETRGVMRHLGWKFVSTLSTSVDSSVIRSSVGDSVGDYFYAVIVAHRDEEEEMAVVVKEEIKEEIKEGVKDEVHPNFDLLEIAPRKAETWMLAAWSGYFGMKSKGGGMSMGAR